MSNFLSKLQVVHLTCPYDSWRDGKTQKIFSDMITLKLTGYQAEYPYGVLPVDTTDLVASHHLVCEKLPNGGLFPLMGYRSISLERCKTHNIAFPVLTLMEATKNFEHAEAIRNIISSCEKEGTDLSYDSSWTILPEIRKDEEKTALLRKVMNSIHVIYHSELGPQNVLAGGSVRFKMERLYYYWGYRDLALNGKNLPAINVPFVFGEKTLFFSLEKLSKEALEMAEEYRGLWESRLVIGELPSVRKKAA